MPGPARLVAPLLLALQQLLEGAAACGRVRAPGPLLLLLGLGPVAGCARDLHPFALNLLEPAPLLIAFLSEVDSRCQHLEPWCACGATTPSTIPHCRAGQGRRCQVGSGLE